MHFTISRSRQNENIQLFIINTTAKDSVVFLGHGNYEKWKNMNSPPQNLRVKTIQVKNSDRVLFKREREIQLFLKLNYLKSHISLENMKIKI